MKKYRKIWAVLLTLAMVLGMSMTTMAANKPTAADKAGITVKNVEKDADVYAYKIIRADYDNNGLIGYKWLAGTRETGETAVTFTDGKVDGLDSDFITGYAKKVTVTDATATAKAGTDNTATLENLTVGTYMILVSPSTKGVTYNPMIASVNYNVNKSGSDNTAGDGEVDASDDWKVNNVVVYAKSSALKLTKDLDDDTKEVVASGENANEKINFTVKTTIPSYSNAYGDGLTFHITDTLVKGLRYAEGAPVVKVGGKIVENVENANYDVTHTGTSFTITFKQNYLRSLAAVANREVVITYGAYATAAATVATPGENTVTLTYSDSLTTTRQLTDTEKVYTFAITGDTIKKVDENNNLLPDATFTLYRAYDASKKELNDVFGTYKTENDGAIKFSGLGAIEKDTDGNALAGQAGIGTYYLKETAAPNGYTINDTVYKVEVSKVTRDGNDDITGYEVTVTNLTNNATVTTTYTKNGAAVTASGDATAIVNTKLTALPSTGGIGTTIFTIGGCAIMIAAAFLFFASRKKNENR